MYKALFLWCFLFLNLYCISQTMNTDILRQEYINVKTDSASCARLYTKITKENSSNNIIICYKGAITASMADYSKNKTEKLKLFSEGKKLVEQCIAKDTSNVELRFLRFTVQTSCPKILGYNKQIEKDKKYILSVYKSITISRLRTMIFDYLYHSSYLTKTEKDYLRID